MKRYPLTENRAGKILFGLFLFAILYLTRSGFTSSAILGINPSQFVTLGLVGILGLVFLFRNRGQWKQILTDKRLMVALVASVLLLLPAAAKRDWQLMYLSVLVCLYIAVFLTYFISYREAAKYYVCILTVIGVYSVIATYLLRRLPDNGSLSVPVVYTNRMIDFYNFGLTFVSGIYVKNRNFGIFREPGVYQYFIMLALFLNNYAVQWKKQRTMWIVNVLLAVTMLTTFATGGIAELGLFVILVFFDKKLYKDKRAVIAAVALILVGAAGLAVIVMQKGQLYWELYGMVIAKIFGGEASSTERIDAVRINLEFFMNNPIFGEKLATVLYALENNTTSTLLMLAIFGVGGGALHIAAWVALVWDKERHWLVNLTLLLILFLSFNTQNLIADVFFWLFPVMALTERVVPWLENRKKKV